MLLLALQSADGLMREVFQAMDIDHDGKISRELEYICLLSYCLLTTAWHFGPFD